jgi:hypothetical protein
LSVELPTKVWENQGTATFTVHVSQAPGQDITVWLTSSDVSELTVPFSVTITAGHTSSSPITANVIDDSDRDGIQTVKVTAVADGYAPAEGTVPVADNEPDHFVLDSIPIEQYIGVSFAVGVWAEDVNNSRIDVFDGAFTLTASNGGSVTQGTWQNAAGHWTNSVSVNKAGASVNMVAANAQGRTGQSNAFVIHDHVVVELVPDAGDVGTMPDGTKLVTLQPGTDTLFHANLNDTTNAIDSYRLNFINSVLEANSQKLTLDTWTPDPVWNTIRDGGLNSFTGDTFVAASTSTAQLPPPAVGMGTFHVHTPLFPSDFLIELNSGGTGSTDTGFLLNKVLQQVASYGTVHVHVPYVGASVDSVSLVEGDAGYTDYLFTVSLGIPAPEALTVDYATADVTATAGVDYVPVSGTLSFALGEQTKKVRVRVLGDKDVEPDETFHLVLSNPSHASLLQPVGTGTILDDSTQPRQIVSLAAGGETASLDWPGGWSVSLPMTYTVSDGDSTLTGLGLRLHFDSSQLTFNDVSMTQAGDMVIPTLPQDDVDDLDADPTTDKFVNMHWESYSGNWPNRTLPLALATANFALAAGAKANTVTTLRFSSELSSPGYGLSADPYAVKIVPKPSMDVDKDGSVTPFTDGMLIFRYLFGFRGSALVRQTLGSGAQRSDPQAIVDYLDEVKDLLLDVDDSGASEPLTDGMLIMRYLVGFRGPTLVKQAVAAGAHRSDAVDIADFLSQFMQAKSAEASKSAQPQVAGVSPAAAVHDAVFAANAESESLLGKNRLARRLRRIP